MPATPTCHTRSRGVQTPMATAADGSVIATIHADRAEATLLPQEHLVDAGYLDADNPVTSRRGHASGRWSETHDPYSASSSRCTSSRRRAAPVRGAPKARGRRRTHAGSPSARSLGTWRCAPRGYDRPSRSLRHSTRHERGSRGPSPGVDTMALRRRALHRARQDATQAAPDRCRDERRSAGGLVRGAASGRHTAPPT